MARYRIDYMIHKYGVYLGGGNWGDLWFGNQRKRRMHTFIEMVQKGKTVIGMPQSLWYNSLMLALEDANEWMKNVTSILGKEKAKKIIMTWRQQDSYDKAVHLYPFVDNRYKQKLGHNHKIRYNILGRFQTQPS